MKKFLFFGVCVLVTCYSAFANVPISSECPVGCETSKDTCCKTKGGSAYYGKL